MGKPNKMCGGGAEGESRFDEFEKSTESALRKPDKRAAIRAP